MSKWFQFSLARLLVAVALVGAGMGSLLSPFRPHGESGWFVPFLLFGGWALCGASIGVLFRLSIGFAIALALIAGIVGFIGTTVYAVTFLDWGGLP